MSLTRQDLISPLQQTQQQVGRLPSGAELLSAGTPVSIPDADPFTPLLQGIQRGAQFVGGLQERKRVAGLQERQQQVREEQVASKKAEGQQKLDLGFLDRAEKLLEQSAIAGGEEGLKRMAQTLGDAAPKGLQSIIEELGEGNFTVTSGKDTFRLVSGVDGKFTFENVIPKTKAEGDFRAFRKEVLKNDSYQSARKAHGAASSVLDLLDTGNPIAANAVKIQLPRLLGEVGNLARTEQEAFGGSQALKDQTTQLFERWKTGKLTPENEAFLREIVVTLDKNAIKRGNQTVSNFIESESALGTDSVLLNKFMNPFRFKQEVREPRKRPDEVSQAPSAFLTPEGNQIFEDDEDVSRSIRRGALKVGDKIFMRDTGKLETIGQ